MNQHDRKHYQFPRTSKEAFGWDVTDADFDTTPPHTGDRVVAIGCVIIALLILFGLVG
jgi:hypothetical protein